MNKMLKFFIGSIIVMALVLIIRVLFNIFYIDLGFTPIKAEFYMAFANMLLFCMAIINLIVLGAKDIFYVDVNAD